jgi:hypothetical protein
MRAVQVGDTTSKIYLDGKNTSEMPEQPDVFVIEGKAKYLAIATFVIAIW